MNKSTEISRALTQQSKAAQLGFDWPDVTPVFEKVTEELDELKEALASGDKMHSKQEFGDLFFAILNIARHLNIDPEQALALTNKKFERRFEYVCKTAATEGVKLATENLAALDAFWEQAKSFDE